MSDGRVIGLEALRIVPPTAADEARAESLRRLATPEGRAAAIRWFEGQGYSPEAARLLATPDMQRCHDPRTLDDIVCCYGGCRDGEAAPPSAPTQRRNEMPKRTRTTAADERRLEAIKKDIGELRRENAAPIIKGAVDEGRIAADETERWLERAERMGVDVVRDLLRERRPNRQLAAAQNVTPVTAEQDAALAEVFPGYVPRTAR